LDVRRCELITNAGLARLKDLITGLKIIR